MHGLLLTHFVLQEVFKSRIKNYKDLTLPLLEHYDKKGIVFSIKGETSDIIYPQLKDLILNKFAL